MKSSLVFIVGIFTAHVFFAIVSGLWIHALVFLFIRLAESGHLFTLLDKVITLMVILVHS